MCGFGSGTSLSIGNGACVKLGASQDRHKMGVEEQRRSRRRYDLYGTGDTVTAPLPVWNLSRCLRPRGASQAACSSCSGWLIHAASGRLRILGSWPAGVRPLLRKPASRYGSCRQLQSRVPGARWGGTPAVSRGFLAPTSLVAAALAALASAVSACCGYSYRVLVDDCFVLVLGIGQGEA